jgi:hypothetical protein
MCIRMLAAQPHPSFALRHRVPRKIEGAGKTGCPPDTRRPRAKRICASASATGVGGEHSGLPCAVVLFRAFLGEPSRLPPSPWKDQRHQCPVGLRAIFTRLGAKILGRQDHTTSPSAPAPLVSPARTAHGTSRRTPPRDSKAHTTLPRPPHSAPTSVTLARRSSIPEQNKTRTQGKRRGMSSNISVYANLRQGEQSAINAASFAKLPRG